MTKQVQRRRGTATQHTSFTGAEGEISVNTTNKSAHVHDGVTAGGFELARKDLDNVTTASVASKVSGGTVSTIDINGGTIDNTVIGGTTPVAGSFTTLSATGNITVGGTVDGRDVAVDGTKLDGIEAGADVTDTANVTAAGALMDSELTNITAVKALNQGVATTDSPSFVGVTASGDVTIADKIVHSGDTNTAIRFPAADTVTVETSGAERLRVDSSGNVGVGTASPGYLLHVQADASPTIASTDTTNTITTIVNSSNTAGVLGTATNHPLALVTNNTERMRIDASGNLGLGVTPRAWGGVFKAFDVNSGGSYSGTSSTARMFGNSYYNGSSYIYKSSGYANYYYCGDGQHAWFNAPSGTAGNAITFTQAMTLDASGNLGVGITNPAYKLVVSAAGASGIELGPAYSGTANLIQHYSRSGGVYVDAVNDAAQHRFNTSGTERVRIDANGGVSIGKTSPSEAASTGSGFGFSSSSTDPFFSVVNTNASGANASAYFNKRLTGSLVVFMTNNGTTNTTVGSISHNGTSTAYNTSSDYRLKEDWQPMTGASERVLSLKPVNFAWKVNGSRVDGFLAHEVQEVVHEAVAGEKDAVDADGNPQYQGIDQSKLVPLLTAALQEALTEIAGLKARITALEA